jgi:hypothetical protein
VTTVINASSAPYSYTYDLDVPEGVTWTTVESGAILGTNATGGLVLGIAPAWAKDANGVPVPTRYEFDGTRLTQIVDHRSDRFAYPVVADPWLGANIFQYTNWNASTQTASARVSPGEA